MELLLRPLRKRFQYHFYGKRQTNNLEKVQCKYIKFPVHWHFRLVNIDGVVMMLVVLSNGDDCGDDDRWWW
jgi:hypothetical protein